MVNKVFNVTKKTCTQKWKEDNPLAREPNLPQPTKARGLGGVG